jgi:hypothetical protein
MGGLRRHRRALPPFFIGSIGLLWLAPVLEFAGRRPPGTRVGGRFPVACPWDGHEQTGWIGGMTCANKDCNRRFVVAPCKCGIQGAVAVGRPHPDDDAREVWRCRTCKEFFLAHLCPKCSELAPLTDGAWRCPAKHPAFEVGWCGECGWFAGQEDSGAFLCEWGGHQTGGEGI